MAAHVTVSGSAVLIQSQSNSRGRVNLTVTVPKSAKVTVNAGWDNVTATGLGAGIDVTARGDIHLNSMTGPVVAHFIRGRHDEFSAHDVQGDLTLNGDLNDLTLSDIKGSVTQDGDLDGDVHLENISGPVRLHTSVTTVELGELPGDLTLDSDDLRITEAKGLVRVISHSKDIDLSQIYGDSIVEDRDGRIAVEPAGNFGVEAKNSKGDVEISLPPDASATVSGRTHNGDIVTDFGLTVSGEEDKTVTGRIGSGTARIALSTDNGDLHIKRGQPFLAEPAAPNAPAAPGAPAPPNARHLKTSKALPQQPVSAVTRVRADRCSSRSECRRARTRGGREPFLRASSIPFAEVPSRCILLRRGSKGNGAYACQGHHSGAGVRLARRGVCARSGGAAGLAAAGLGAGGGRGAHGRRGSEDGRQIRRAARPVVLPLRQRSSGTIRCMRRRQAARSTSSTPSACWS